MMPLFFCLWSVQIHGNVETGTDRLTGEALGTGDARYIRVLYVNHEKVSQYDMRGRLTCLESAVYSSATI